MFSIPYHLGWDIIGVADYLQVHGWLEWLKWIGVDGRNRVKITRLGNERWTASRLHQYPGTLGDFGYESRVIMNLKTEV